jgi:hypothetical protein
VTQPRMSLLETPSLTPTHRGPSLHRLTGRDNLFVYVFNSYEERERKRLLRNPSALASCVGRGVAQGLSIAQVPAQPPGSNLSHYEGTVRKNVTPKAAASKRSSPVKGELSSHASGQAPVALLDEEWKRRVVGPKQWPLVDESVPAAPHSNTGTLGQAAPKSSVSDVRQGRLALAFPKHNLKPSSPKVLRNLFWCRSASHFLKIGGQGREGCGGRRSDDLASFAAHRPLEMQSAGFPERLPRD